nr:type II toxin-antitoxin system PemK/MazF family toxin [uncultured Dysosmobacter sp.]
MYYTDLYLVTGFEQFGIRPELIKRNDVGNRLSPTVTEAARLQAWLEKRLPTHMRLNGAVCELFRSSIVMLEQIQTLDRSRLGEYM